VADLESRVDQLEQDIKLVQDFCNQLRDCIVKKSEEMDLSRQQMTQLTGLTTLLAGRVNEVREKLLM